MTSKTVISDIHGCIDEFHELIDKLNPSSPSEIILVGDLVDRGPDSAGVVRFCRESGFTSILGNHDEKYLRYRNHELKKTNNPKYRNPMNLGKAKLEVYESLTEEDFDYISKMPLFLNLGNNLVVVHGGVNREAAKTPLKEIIRRRFVYPQTGAMASLDKSHKPPEGTVFWTDVHKGPETVIYGHEVHDLVNPRITYFEGGACIGIDQGCCFGGRLTAMVIKANVPGNLEYEFVQVQAKRVYFNKHNVFEE